MDFEKLKQMGELIQIDLKQLEDKKGKLAKIIRRIQAEIYCYSIYNSKLRKDVHIYKKLLSLTAQFIPKIALQIILLVIHKSLKI